MTDIFLTEADAESSSLTDKQVEVLELVCDRRTNKEIALLLGVSPSAVEQRLQSVRRKLGAHSRADLARAYEKMQASHTYTNHTGAEYQVETSIPDSQSPDKNLGGLSRDGRPDTENAADVLGWAGVERRQPSTMLANDLGAAKSGDHFSNVMSKISAIATTAAAIALLVIVISEIAPALQP